MITTRPKLLTLVYTDNQTAQRAAFPEVVALTGFMGTGKTTVGRTLAHLLRWSFFDLDYEIEFRQNLSVRELFQRYSESKFREIETDTLHAVLQQASGPTVIALGGGTSVQSANAELLRSRGVRVVFLETAIEELLQRCRVADQNSPENPRPLAATPEVFCALYVQRLPYYRTADLTVNATNKAVEELAQEIASTLGLASRLH